jgi:hypothetical protein
MNGQFYASGFTILRIEQATADFLLKTIQRESFLPVSSVFDVYASKTVSTRNGQVVEPEFNVKIRESLKDYWKGVAHPQIWKNGVNGDFSSVSPFVEYPEALKSFWSDFSEQNLKWFSKTWGPFDHMGLLAHNYSTGQSLGYHHDLSDSTQINCIGYLGDADFSEGDGGYLEIAECDVDGYGLPIEGTIKTVYKVMPNHGTVVVMDNTNPRLLHRVEPLKSPKLRITLSCQFGYLSNILAKKTNKF